MFPPGGAGFVSVPSSLAPAGRRTADANPQTIGTTGPSEETQTSYGMPFTMESDIRCPLEGMRNTSSFDEKFRDF